MVPRWLSPVQPNGSSCRGQPWKVEKAHPWLGSLYNPDETSLLLGPTWRHRGYLGTCTSLSDTEAQGKSNCTSTGQASAYITSANIPFPRANSMAKPKVKEWGSDWSYNGARTGCECIILQGVRSWDQTCNLLPMVVAGRTSQNCHHLGTKWSNTGHLIRFNIIPSVELGFNLGLLSNVYLWKELCGKQHKQVIFHKKQTC